VTIKSKDNGNPSESFTKTFVFSVDDENEAPSDITVSPSEVREHCISNKTHLICTRTTRTFERKKRYFNASKIVQCSF
jgi:hypothetical protein